MDPLQVLDKVLDEDEDARTLAALIGGVAVSTKEEAPIVYAAPIVPSPTSRKSVDTVLGCVDKALCFLDSLLSCTKPVQMVADLKKLCLSTVHGLVFFHLSSNIFPGELTSGAASMMDPVLDVA